MWRWRWQSGARVGLMDADIYGPNTPTMLGVEKLPPPNGPRIIPAEAYGLKMVSMGLLVKPGQPLIWRGPMLNSAIRQFFGDVEWGELDYLIVDLPPGTGDAALSLAQALPLSGAVIVTLPQLVSLEDASRGLNMFKTLEVPILGVVENMSYLEMPDGSRMDLFGSGGGEKLAQATETTFLGGVPIDQNVRIGGDTGKPISCSPAPMFFGVPTPVLSLSKGSNLPALGDCFGKTKSASQRHVPRLCSYDKSCVTNTIAQSELLGEAQLKQKRPDLASGLFCFYPITFDLKKSPAIRPPQTVGKVSTQTRGFRYSHSHRGLACRWAEVPAYLLAEAREYPLAEAREYPLAEAPRYPLETRRYLLAAQM
jgi:hypothetical protein